MRLTAVTACTLAALLNTVHAAPTRPDSHELLVETSSGKINGFTDPSFPDVRQFLGIPFAKPATKELRFAPPQRFMSHDMFNASKTPHACPQFQTTAPTIWSVSTPQFLNSAPWSEDCLSLSVWAPKMNSTQEKLPVFIWIHGGGLQSGSSSVPYQQPPPWIQRSKSHIVVALQYRLNIFGFPNAAGLNQTNLGLMDQRMGIEWVRDNIASFGGDRDNMILWGQSSGAASTDAQNFAFPQDPIVKGFIQDSGSALIPVGQALVTEDPTHSNFTFVAEHVGCKSSSPSDQLSCMRALPAQTIVDFMANYTNAGTAPPLNFIGTPDDRWVFADYAARYARGQLSRAPAVYGSNAAEGNLAAPFPRDPQHEGPDAAVALAATLSGFQCPDAHSAGNRTAARNADLKTYRYLYAGNFSDVSPLFWEGAYHAAELPQVFGTRGMFGRGEASEYEVKTSEAMQDLWLGFARNVARPEAAGWVEARTGGMLMLGASGGGPAVKVVNQTVVDEPCKQHGL
ncbi:Carboxylesterase [Lasiodiplodia theobromae]|uniref:Carboxylic ester hydrolase n=1 Tax=Lasiodiplodia theobromae TaxID=45133 RepID=A0A5N5D4W2_9PEZI|nr:Carboxylesterase [Lasiodiplodia theobromae]KAB2572756.1 Cholinesterase [Lasiodiplodia theobromae]KAF4541332.1 Carboxylesterase [Lasiodiplodia theobromae]